jgi:hypothetical protein
MMSETRRSEGRIVNRTKLVLTLVATLLGAGASTAAFAWGHTRFSFGVVIGAPFYPWYYPPYYYYPPPVVVVPAAPTTYIEKDSPHAAPSPRSYWYYCEASKTYYPYVKECPGGWLRVVPQTTPPQAAPQSAPKATLPSAPQETARAGPD